MANKRTTIFLDDNVFVELKVYCAKNNISIKEFLCDAINEKLNK
jgi:hypothetical protein